MNKEQTGSWNLTPGTWGRIQRLARYDAKAIGARSIHVSWAIIHGVDDQNPLTNPYKGKSEELKMYGNLDKLRIYKRNK